MALPRLFLAAIVVSVVALLASVLFFFQYKDPMMLVFAFQLSMYAWIIALIIHVWRVGIPIRIVGGREP